MRVIAKARYFLRSLFRRRRTEEDLGDELRYHFEQAFEENIRAGMPPEEARFAAQRLLGSVSFLKEECRDAWGTRWLSDLSSDVRYAIRTLRQNPGFAAVALVTLALGTGATTVMFTVIDRVLLKPLPYAEPNRLIALYGQTDKYGESWGASYLDYLDIRRESKSLDVASWTDGGGTVGSSDNAEYVGGARISANLFAVLGTPLLRGRGFRADEDQAGGAPVIIITSSLWQRRYRGSEAIVGSSIIFEGKPRTVVGIATSAFELLESGEAYLPLGQSWADPRMQNRGARFAHVVARLRPAVAAASAQVELDVIARRLAAEYPRFDSGHRFTIRPLGKEVVGGVQFTLWLLLAAVGLVLLIACANIASLLLARAISRERERGLRAALGAGRGRLIRQCFTESAVLGLAGGCLGILLAAVGTRPFVVFWPGVLPRAGEIRAEWQVFAIALAVALVSGLLFGTAPALRASKGELENALRAGSRTVSSGSRRMHGLFVTGELAWALVLLVAAGMLGRTMLRLSALDPGVNLHNVLTARVEPAPGASSPAAMRASWQEFLERTRHVPGVASAALADIIPMREGENELGYSTSAEMPPPERIPLALASCVTPDYLVVVGLTLRQGRFFTEQDRLGGELVVVIDDVMAEHAFGGTTAVGRHLWVQGMGPGPLRVIGVVGHVRHWGLAGDDQSRLRDQLYYPLGQLPDRFMPLLSSVMSVAVRTRIEPLSLVDQLGRERTGGQVLHDVHTLEQLAGASLARQRFLLLLFGVFSMLALVLACVGIYGVLAYLTSRRVPEIGVRMALGASAREVMWLVLRQSLGMIWVGVGAGLFVAVAAAQLLTRFVDGMLPAEPSTFVVMIAALVTAALLASFAPALRASRVDPMAALRGD